MTEEEWIAEHKGAYLRTEGYVWWCGDEWCDCTKAQIVEVYSNRKVYPGVVRICIWEGTFFTDGASGAYEELRAKREEMTPEAAAAIEWT